MLPHYMNTESFCYPVAWKEYICVTGIRGEGIIVQCIA